MTNNNNKVEITITITYNRNIMYHVKERTATAASPRLSLAAPAGGLLRLTPWNRHECHAEVCMQCQCRSVAHAAPPRRATGPECSPRFAGAGGAGCIVRQ